MWSESQESVNLPATLHLSPERHNKRTVGVIRSGGHLSRGEYDVQTDGRHAEAMSARRQFTDEFKAGAVAAPARRVSVGRMRLRT